MKYNTNRYGELTVTGLRDLLNDLIEKGYGNYDVHVADTNKSYTTILPPISINTETEVVKFINED